MWLVTPSLDDAFPVAVGAGIEQFGVTTGDRTPDRLIAEVPTPDSLPAMSGIVITPRGVLLVMREGQLPSHTHSLYDVFDREGVWLGTISTGKVVSHFGARCRLLQ